MFAELAAELAAGPGRHMTAFGLEELLDERGRELQRQLLQDHLDLRAAREEQRAGKYRAPATGTDGITRTRLETGHGRLLATLFGMFLCPVRLAPSGTGEFVTGRRRPVAAGRPAFPFLAGWPRSRRSAAPSRPRTPRSHAGAGR